MAAMFKKEKDLTERSRALLKNKETKKLTAEVSRFSGISRTSMVLDEVECKLWCKWDILASSDAIVTYHDQSPENSIPVHYITSTLYRIWFYPHFVKAPYTLILSPNVSSLKSSQTRQILSKFSRLQESDLDGIFRKEQLTRIVLATRTIIYSIGDVPYFIDFEGD